MIAAGRKPHLALELHNDGNGLLHISRPPVPQLERHLERMATLEALLRKHTWFTEGSTNPAFRNSGTLGDGWLERYGIDAAVHEFNCNWIEGLKQPSSSTALARVWCGPGACVLRVLRDREAVAILHGRRAARLRIWRRGRSGDEGLPIERQLPQRPPAAAMRVIDEAAAVGGPRELLRRWIAQHALHSPGCRLQKPRAVVVDLEDYPIAIRRNGGRPYKRRPRIGEAMIRLVPRGRSGIARRSSTL